MSFAIELDSTGSVTLSQPVKADCTLWAGDINLGNVSGNTLPLHAIANNMGAIQRLGLTLATRDFAEQHPVDASRFLECYSVGLLDQMQRMIGPNRWVVYSIGISGEKQVTANFGLVVPIPQRGHRFVIFCNGKPMDHASITLDPHFAHGCWFMPTESVLACRAVFEAVDVGDYLEFSISFPGAPDEKFLPLFSYTNTALLEGLPDVARIRRVSGPVANQNSYLNGGKTAAERLMILMDHYHSGGRRLLDWGIGCGRVALHFASRPNIALTGIDIDRDNLEWCAANLPGRYETVGLMPPTPFDESSFDVIYSCSVLSHLTEKVAHAWLAELARVLAPDGVALLSFNGSANLASYLGRRPLEMQRAIQNGLFDNDINHDLDGFIPSKDYYRASFAETTWWTSVFEQHFNIVAIEPAVVSGYQDIAVLRRS
jgi:SAM-dependent methyltransferase